MMKVLEHAFSLSIPIATEKWNCQKRSDAEELEIKRLIGRFSRPKSSYFYFIICLMQLGKPRCIRLLVNTPLIYGGLIEMYGVTHGYETNSLVGKTFLNIKKDF